MLRKTFDVLLIILFSYLVGTIISDRIIDRKSTRVLSIEIETNHAGHWQLFWRNKGPFNQEDSGIRRIKDSGIHTIQFPLLEKKIRSLRLDPPDAGKGKINEFSIHSIKISNGFGVIYEKTNAEDVVPRNSTVKKVDRNQFIVTGVDPQLELKIPNMIMKVDKGKHTGTRWLLRLLFLSLCSLLIFLGVWLIDLHKFGNKISAVLFRSLRLFPFLLSGGLIASMYGFINGFPLLFSDTGMYLKSGVEWFVPDDRPVMYGVYLLVSSLRYYLWIPIILQGMMITYCCYLLLENVVRDRNDLRRLTLFLMLVLSLFTSLSWFSSQLAPDIFCAIAPLALLILYLDSSQFISRKIVLMAIFIVCNLSHPTSMLINVAFSAFLLVMAVLLRRYFSFKKVFLICAVSVFSFPLTMILNYSISGNLAMGENSYIFTSAKLADLGLLQKYLRENPKGREYKIAEMVDDIKERSNHFIWSNESVIHNMPRNELKSELKEINRDILSNPSSFSYLIWTGIKRTFKLFSDGSSNYGFDSYKNKYVHGIVKKHFPHLEKDFLNSMQQRWEINGRLNLISNSILLWVSYISVPVLLIIFRKRLTPNVVVACINVFFILLVNDFICATLSTTASRYHARISWIVVVALFILVVSVVDSFNAKNVHKDL